MTIEKIIPIIAICLVIIGFLIMIIGFIWMAHTISSQEITSSFSNTEDLIGEMNQMFTYFTEKLDKGSQDIDHIDKDEDQDKRYDNVIRLNREGKAPDQIAKELDMGKGEVNLILGIDRMR